MRRFHRVTIPERAHPLVRQMFQEMNRQQIGITDLAERAGLARETLKGWRTKHCPRVADLEAAFGVLKKKLKVCDE